MDFNLDFLKCYQDHEFELPVITEEVLKRVNVKTGEETITIQPRFKHEGSFSTSISIKISGQRITMEGNPSRFNRMENLFGFTKLDECFSVYNHILLSLGLPPFTKCTKLYFNQGEEGTKVGKFSDGAVIQRLDINSNISTGGYTKDYLTGLATLRYRNSIPRLHTNGCTVDWLSAQGNANLIYPSVYNKANELKLRTLPKVKRNFGENSKEYQHILQVINYCELHGVARFEQKLQSRFLQKNNLNYWGLFNESSLREIQKQFLSIDENLKVSAMDIETISEQLISDGIVNTTRAANTTALYAIEWAHGKSFDFSKRQVQLHRSRLRQIGLDIKDVFNASTFSPIVIRKCTEVNVTSLPVPNWYQMPQTSFLTLVA